MKKPFGLFLFLWLWGIAAKGQCPEKSSVWKRLEYLRDSSKNFNDQVRELEVVNNDYNSCASKADSAYIFLQERLSKAYFERHDFQKSLNAAQRAIRTMRENPDIKSLNQSWLILCYLRIALAYGGLEQTYEKMVAIDSCIGISRRLKQINEYSLYAISAKVDNLYYSGEFAAAVDYSGVGEQQSQDFISNTNAANSSNQYKLNFSLAKIKSLIALNKVTEAEDQIQQCLTECRNKKLDSYFGSLYHFLGNVTISKKNYLTGIGYYQQALFYNTKNSIPADCKAAEATIGFQYFHLLKNYKKALYYYFRSFLHVNDKPLYNRVDSLTSLNVYNLIANVYVARGRFDSARYFFGRAFDHLKKSANEEYVLNASLNEFMNKQNVEYISNLFFDKVNMYMMEYKKTGGKLTVISALRMCRYTDRLLDKIRLTQSEMQSKLFWREEAHRFYEMAIETSILADNSAEAFYFFEKSRAILLNDQLNDSRWLGEDAIRQQTRYKNSISRLEKQMKTLDIKSKEHQRLQTERLGQKESLNKLGKKVKKENELYFQSFLDTSFTTLKEMRAVVLKDHQALVEIFTGDSAVYTMVITRGKSFFNRIKRSDYDHLANRCITMISSYDTLNRHFEEFTRASQRLYHLLFNGAEVPEGRIIISPDGKYFPFEALVTGFNGKTPIYFIAHHAVSYTFSARYLMNNFAGSRKQDTRNFLGMAPVQFPMDSKLVSLPGSDRSTKTISDMFAESEIRIGPEASRKAFLSAFSKHKIVQLYTHSSETSAQGEPVIYFADTALYMSDLSSDKKPVTSLIVLSACQTGNGQEYLGEGIFSFNRAFAALGIPSCVNTLWSVDNESTYRINELFYSNISDGIPIDIALQQAKLEFMKSGALEYQLPYFWAASILAGKTEALQVKPNYVGIWGVLLAVTAIAAFLGYKSYKRFPKKKKVAG